MKQSISRHEWRSFFSASAELLNAFADIGLKESLDAAKAHVVLVICLGRFLGRFAFRHVDLETAWASVLESRPYFEVAFKSERAKLQ